MENLTHSLLGATLAELALPDAASPAQRRLFFTVGVVAANLPDADLLYTRIMPDPLGYLLHHRGHTHTFVGLIGLAAVIGIAMLVPRFAVEMRKAPMRFWLLVSGALVSHVVADSWNVYGVHPFWPFDSRWYYGDAVSIFEPWLWVILGLAVGANTRSTAWRRVLLVLPPGLVALAATIGMIQRESALVLLVAAGIMWVVGRRLAPKRRSYAALAGTAVFLVLSMLFSQSAYARARESLGVSADVTTLDIALSPRPAQPMCWSAVAIRTNTRTQEYFVLRGAVSVAPVLLGTLGCRGESDVVWLGAKKRSVGTLNELVERDCWVRAWMQFARIPWPIDDTVVDERFNAGSRASFTAMKVSPVTRSCPAHMTSWGMPREDLITR